MSRNEYHEKANKFLADNGLIFKAQWKDTKCPPWEDGNCIQGDRYRVTILRKGSLSIAFDFWNSANARDKGEKLTAYDVLACISGDVNTPETFEDFCSEFGESTDSIKAKQTFNRCSRFAKRLRDFFTAQEIEQLQEIQ